LVGFINDITCRVRQDKNFLNNSSLVVRVNEKYTSFSMAAPILMSVLMFKVRIIGTLIPSFVFNGVADPDP
jgi:hypothetical protein